MDIGTVLLYGLPVTVVMIIISLKFMFNVNEKDRKIDTLENEQCPEKSANKKDKKKVQRKKIETAPATQVKNSGDSKAAKKTIVKETVKPAVKVVEKPVKIPKEIKKTLPVTQNTKKVEKKKLKKQQEVEINDDSWTTVTKKPRTLNKTDGSASSVPVSMPNVDLHNEKATLTVEQVMQLTTKEVKVEQIVTIQPPKQESRKVEVEKKKKIPKMVAPSIEDQLEAAMEDTEFETVKSRNRKNRKSVEDAKASRPAVLTPPSYEESLTQIAQEKAAAVTFDEMGALENTMQTKVKPSRKKKSRRD